VQLDRLAGREHADDGRGAAGRQHGKGLLGGFLAAQHLEGVMHAATGEFTHLLHHVAPGGIDDVGGAKLGGKLQFHQVGIDRDDAAGTCDRSTVDRSHDYAAATDHGYSFAGLKLGRIYIYAVLHVDADTEHLTLTPRHVLM